MKQITKEMIIMWNMSNIDWMGYEVRNRREYTYHHIFKKEYGGLETFNNGAILSGESSHPYLHIIEMKDLEMYIYLNNLLQKINEQRCMPNKQQLITISECLKSFEREHCSDRTKKGKRLIKEEYTRRIIR